MSLTIDCGEGKHDICRGRGKHHYLIPQENDGTEFICSCPCHKSKGVKDVNPKGAPMQIRTR